MKVYQINYDLRKNRDYTSLFDKIESYDTWARPLESCWLVATNHSASQIVEALSAVLDADDGLLVTRISREAAWRSLNHDNTGTMTNWLKKQLSQAE